MSCEHGNWSPCEACDKEAALHARIEALEKERDFAKTEIARLHDDIRELTDVRVLDEEDRDRIVAWLQGTSTKPAPSVPTVAAAAAMGARGGPALEGERLAFEAWVLGHGWSLCARWNGEGYVGDLEQGGAVCPHAMRTRMIWAAWRDRAALAHLPMLD